MIDLGVDDDLELLRETAQSFAAEHLTPHERQHEAEGDWDPSKAAEREAWAPEYPRCT
jgi:alkylation response protein AidB-like acyl-CoA dehydrogenase